MCWGREVDGVGDRGWDGVADCECEVQELYYQEEEVLVRGCTVCGVWNPRRCLYEVVVGVREFL